jgi:LmbE family N-acetylglucosaminyl deacetylase
MIDTPVRALAIAAHPDDVAFGCGATLAKWAANGWEI